MLRETRQKSPLFPSPKSRTLSEGLVVVFVSGAFCRFAEGNCRIGVYKLSDNIAELAVDSAFVDLTLHEQRGAGAC